MRELHDPARRLHDAAAQYVDAVLQAPSDASGSVASPLPWLPDRPRPTDPAWSRYLDERSELVATLATRVRRDAAEAVAAARPGTALSRQDPGLTAAREVFLAVHGRAVGPDDLSDAERGYLSDLDGRLERHRRDALQAAEGNRKVAVVDRGVASLSLGAATYAQRQPEQGLSL